VDFRRARIFVMPDETQLIEQSKQLLGQLTPDVRPIFWRGSIVSAIRDAGNKIAHAINAKDKKWESAATRAKNKKHHWPFAPVWFRWNRGIGNPLEGCNEKWSSYEISMFRLTARLMGRRYHDSLEYQSSAQSHTTPAPHQGRKVSGEVD
jgi:hypothetical protein